MHFCLSSLLLLWDLNFSSIKIIFLGIAIGQQHLIWQEHELDDESSLHDYGVPSGGTLRLVLGMRGGPINTRRVPVEPPSWADEAGQSVADFMWPSASNKQVCLSSLDCNTSFKSVLSDFLLSYLSFLMIYLIARFFFNFEINFLDLHNIANLVLSNMLCTLV